MFSCSFPVNFGNLFGGCAESRSSRGSEAFIHSSPVISLFVSSALAKIFRFWAEFDDPALADKFFLYFFPVLRKSSIHWN